MAPISRGDVVSFEVPSSTLSLFDPKTGLNLLRRP
jgi:hypothetical protein